MFIKKRIFCILSIIMIALFSMPSVSALDYTPKYPMTGNVNGLTLLIDFPDVNSSITRQDIDNMLNQTGYTGYDNACSVKDYFYRCSGGALTYTNTVADYYTAPNNKSYYDDNTSFSNSVCKDRTEGLIEEALQALANSGFDFSTLTVNSNNNVLALNILYEGNPFKRMCGLYPHSERNYSFQIGGVNFTTYQLTSIGDVSRTGQSYTYDDLSIDTFIHENGHMLCKWPDLYLNDQYGSYYGTGVFDVMSSVANRKNPAPPDPFLRNIISGWGTAISLNDYAEGSRITVTPNSVDSYMFRKSTDIDRYYMIESLDYPDGGCTSFPCKGLAVYYVDESVNRLPVSLIEADGNRDIFFNAKLGEVADLFYEGNNSSFTAYTNPSTTYNDEIWFQLQITQINSSGTEFTYHGKLLGMPGNLSFVNDGENVRLSWGDVTGASEYEVSIDNNSYVSTGLNTYYSLDNTSSHHINVKAKDANGRISNTQAIGIKYGDINKDGQITIADKNLLTDYLLDPIGSPLTNEQLVAADVNGDGLIDALDCTNINMYANGIISDFPGGRVKLIIYGDLNGDGIVTPEDLGSVYWNWEEDVLDSRQKIAAEVDANGVIDSDDFVAIEKYLNGNFSNFPVMN